MKDICFTALEIFALTLLGCLAFLAECGKWFCEWVIALCDRGLGHFGEKRLSKW